jgi:hypothetical protein
VAKLRCHTGYQLSDLAYAVTGHSAQGGTGCLRPVDRLRRGLWSDLPAAG